MKKIFLLSEYVNPSDNSTGYYWNAIIRSVANNFGAITVICPEQHAGTFREDIDSVDFLFIGKRRFSDKKLFFRVLGQLSRAAGFAWYLLTKVRKGDAVICGTNPALFVLLMPILKKLKSFTWLLLIHDVFPENLVPAKILSTSNVLYALLKSYSDWAYRAPDKIVVIGRDMQCLVENKIGRQGGTTLIQNWVCLSDVAALPKEAALFLTELGWHEKIVFQFFGNMGRVQGIENILAAIKQVTHPKAAFLFIGNGVMAPTIKGFIRNNPSLAVAYFVSPPNEERASALAACDVALITLERGMLGLGVPSKSYFSLAADKPLLAITDFGSEIQRVVTEDGIGWWCKPDDPRALSSIIDEICSLDLNVYSGRPRAVIVDKYSDEIALDKFCRVVRELVDNRTDQIEVV